MFLFSADREHDLFRSILANGHYETVKFLLEIDDFSLELPQNRIDLILRYSAIYGPLESTKFIFSLGIFRFTMGAFQNAFKNICLHGKVSLVPSFLAVAPSAANGETLLEISSKGHLDVLKLLLSSNAQFSNDTIVQVATEAFRTDNFAVLETIFTFSENLGFDLRSLPFLFELFAKDEVEICRLILDSIFFDREEEIRDIVHHAGYAAFTLDKPDVLWFLFDDTGLIFDQMAQDQILTSAISGSVYDSDLLKNILYDLGFKFSEWMRENAIALALKSPNASKIVPVLLECPQFSPNEYLMTLALFSALELDKFELFNEIVAFWKLNITPSVFKSILEEICNVHKPRYVKTILENSANPLIYPKELQAYVLLLVAKQGNLNLVKLVMNYGFNFSRRSLKRAIHAARWHKQTEKYLISKLNNF